MTVARLLADHCSEFTSSKPEMKSSRYQTYPLAVVEVREGPGRLHHLLVDECC